MVGTNKTVLVRVTSKDFCCGLIYNADKSLCLRAADKFELFIGRGIHKLLQVVEANKWTIEYL